MQKDSEFQEIVSEDNVDFEMSAAKLMRNQKYLNLQTVNNQGPKNIQGKGIIVKDNKEAIRKRMGSQQNEVSKPVSYRERSKNRYSGAPGYLEAELHQINSGSIINSQTLEVTEPLKVNIHKSNDNESDQKNSLVRVYPGGDTEETGIKSSNKTRLNQSQEYLKTDTKNQKGLSEKKEKKVAVQEKLDKNTKDLKLKKHEKIINEQKLTQIKTQSKNEALEKIYGLKKTEPRKLKEISKERVEKDRDARRLRLDRAKEILSGKITIVWIYVISTPISQDLRDRIYEVYKGLFDDQVIVPFVKEAWQIEPFLNLTNTYFKIVTNIENAEQALKYKINIKVVEYYIYNDEGEAGMSRALEYKSWSKKVKGIYSNLERIIDKTEQEIDDTIQIYKYNNGLQASIKQMKFPSFLKLSGKDKTEATLYRANLYGAIKIDQNDKKIGFVNFMMLVREKYGKIEKERENLIDYGKIKHLDMIKTKEQAEKIIKFYVRESFYYQVLNSMLRTLKTTEEFKSCILPFNQTYHSVKYFYQDYVKECNRKIPAMTLYRGAKLKKRDFKSLEPGVFIQMYGFMSTSKSLESAKKFTDQDGYIFVISVKQREIPAKWDLYDHGFVDINKNKLAGQQFVKEQQILFNALNIYRVTGIERKGAHTYIHLEYGAIFSLLSKPKETLQADQKDILINYQYCTRLMSDIEDQGDVHLMASEFDQAKDYYLEKIGKNQQDAKSYFKLANVQKQCGQIDEAQKNGQKSLQLMTRQLDLNDKETCLKVFSIHSKNAEINIQKQDYLNADEELTKGLEMLDDDDTYNKAKKIRQRGDIKFKKGEIKDAEKDYDLSEKMFTQIEKQGEKKKWEVQKRYVFSMLTLWCSSMTKSELEENKQKELSQIQELEKSISEMRDSIDDELVKVNKSLKDVALYVEDKDKYEYCVKKGRALLLNVQQRETNDPVIKAKLKVMEATIQDYLQLAESEKLINDAIALIEADTPFDPTVGEYANILAKIQKKEMDKYNNPESLKLSPDKKTEYNQAERKGIYNRCKSNFQKAIKILLYNNKSKDSPEIVSIKNQLGELEMGQNNFKSCEEIIREVKQTASHLQHTQISKASLLLGKIAFARGELKNSFKILEEADMLLKKVIIKSAENPKYVAIYEKNDIYLEILLTKSKVFHKQLNHDTCLRQLGVLEQKVIIKMDGYECHNLLAAVYEQMAEVHASKGSNDFFGFFQKAIKIREKQMGQYNLFNAVSYCNYAKYLMMINQTKAAEENLAQAVQIFSCLSNDHPINWVIHFSNGIFYELKNKFKEADQLFKSCLKMAEKKFDSSHITIKKVRLRVAKVLLKLGSIDESFRELQQLQQQIQQDLYQSRLKIDVVQQIDDEKITLEKIILTELKNVIAKEQNNLRFSQVELQKYKKKYDNLKLTFRLQHDQKESQ